MPKKTIKEIDERGGYYIVGVKGNQKKLLESIKEITMDPSNQLDEKTEEENNRDRKESRQYTLYKNPDANLKELWTGLSQIIKVKRVRLIHGIQTEELSFYITNKLSDLNELSQGIRGHWSIENSLHWIKDVTFGEDKTIHKHKTIAENKSILINIAMNILRKNEIQYLKKTMRLYCNDIRKMMSVLV